VILSVSMIQMNTIIAVLNATSNYVFLDLQTAVILYILEINTTY
jgi:hypothetical protein